MKSTAKKWSERSFEEKILELAGAVEDGPLEGTLDVASTDLRLAITALEADDAEAEMMHDCAIAMLVRVADRVEAVRDELRRQERTSERKLRVGARPGNVGSR